MIYAVLSRSIFLSRIYAISGVQFTGLNIWWQKQLTNMRCAYRSPRKFSINSVKTLVNNSNSNQNQMVKSSQLKTETSRTANCFPLSIKRRKKEVNYCDFHLVLLNKKKVKRSKSIIVESSRGQAALSARYRLGRSYILI